MEKYEVIVKLLTKYSALTAREISAFARRDLNFEISPASVSGLMRTMINRGRAATSKDIKNHSVYWLIKEEV